MSVGNRGDHTKAGLIAGIFVAALFVITFAWPAYLSQREIQNDASRNASYYSESAQKNVATKCVGLSGQARADCANPIEETARSAQREEYDLAAQQTVAVWTAVMGGVAVFGVALSAIGVFLVWTTFDATRKANAIAEDSHEMTNRPILTFEFIGFKHRPIDGRAWWGSPNLLNIGKGPALIKQVDVTVHVVPPLYEGSLQQLFENVRIPEEDRNDVVGAGGTYPCEATYIELKKFETQPGRYRDLQEGVYLSIFVNYCSAIGGDRNTYTTKVIARCVIPSRFELEDGSERTALYTNDIPDLDTIEGLMFQPVPDGSHLT